MVGAVKDVGDFANQRLVVSSKSEVLHLQLKTGGSGTESPPHVQEFMGLNLG